MFLPNRRWHQFRSHLQLWRNGIQMEWERVSNSPGHTLCKSNNHLMRDMHQTGWLPGKKQKLGGLVNRSKLTPSQYPIVRRSLFLSLRSVKAGSILQRIIENEISFLIIFRNIKIWYLCFNWKNELEKIRSPDRIIFSALQFSRRCE